MNRDYTQGKSDSVTYFTGIEVEKTPVYGMKTLFVVGLQNPKEMMELAEQHGCKHIYLGANHSFTDRNQETWEAVALVLLKNDLWVTLDFDIKLYDSILDLLAVLSEHDRFIAQISVKLPYLDNLNYHACVKIDDRDFRSTNAGVWVHQLHDLKDRQKFTDWSQYTKDDIIK